VYHSLRYSLLPTQSQNTPQLSHSLRQSVFSNQSQNSYICCPNHSVSLYLHPNHIHHTATLPLTTAVYIHFLIIKLTTHIFHSPLHSVFTTQSENLTHTCRTHSVCVYSQPNHKLHPRAAPITASFCIQNPITKQNPNLSLSLRVSVL
jgi:hypothetical protein